MINLILLIIEVWFLVGILLILHWSSKKVGLTPLLVFMGGLTGALQLQSLGWVTIKVVGLSFNLDSNILLPVLLFGLLIVYVINGTLWARGILTGMIVVTIVAALFQILLPIHVSLPGGVSTLDTAPGYAPRILIASIIAFALDLVSLILIYQTLCNLRNRFPSRLAAGTALLFALWCDAIIFPLVGFGGKAALGQHILSHLAGKSIVGIALYPLLLIYLQKSGLRFPDSSASIPRPALDFLTTSMQMEAQGRHHFSLLRTLSELNKLVVSSTDSQEILQQACRLIAGSRDYQLVCIALREGEKVEQLIQISSKNCDLTDLLTNETSLCRKVFNAKKHVVFNDIRTKDSNEGSWQEQAIQHGFRAAASFPMRYMGQLYGVFSVFLAKPYAFDKTEVEILQDLADDLAYALISIKAREQQAILQTAAETMQDGLLIADLEGNLVYVNSIVAKIAGIPTNEIIGLNIIDLLSKEQALDFKSTLNVLIKRGHLPLTIDYHSPLGRKIVISTHSALVHNEQGQPQHIVINIRDITSQRQYENQLVTLNRLTTDLVQIHD
jgi:PAS domain S-box-containing protein